MSKQFGTLDNLADRREIMRLFNRLADGVSEEEGQARCGLAVQRLLSAARSPVVKPAAKVSAMRPVEAYMAFVGLTGVLGAAPVASAMALEDMVRHL